MKELKFNELQEVNGGGWQEAGQAFLGTMQVAWAPARAIISGSRDGIGQAMSGISNLQTACKNNRK